MDAEYEYRVGQLRADFPKLLSGFGAESIATVVRLKPDRNLVYGSGPRQTFDFFRTSGKATGTIAFFHAGYWLRYREAVVYLCQTEIANVDAGLAIGLVDCAPWPFERDRILCRHREVIIHLLISPEARCPGKAGHHVVGRQHQCGRTIGDE